MAMISVENETVEDHESLEYFRNNCFNIVGNMIFYLDDKAKLTMPEPGGRPGVVFGSAAAEDCPMTAIPDGDSEACAACQNLPKQSHEAALSQGTRKTGALPASPALSRSAITLIAPIWEA